MMIKEEKPIQVNIRKLFQNKNPKLARLIPGFIFRYLEKIAHQDEVNDFLRKHGSKTGVDFAKASIEEFNIKLEICGKENIPLNGRYIFASNHPLGGFDGLVLVSVLNDYYKETRFLVNDLLMAIPQLRPIFLPINKHGSHSREAAQIIEDAFASDMQILTFPAGLVSRRIKGKIVDLIWKKNFIAKAISYKRDIVPVFFKGRCSNFFYNLSTFRKSIGIKANIEMLYLVDETMKQKNASIKVVFGKPIPYSVYNKIHTHDEWAKLMKEHVYKLENNPMIDFVK